MSDEKNNLRTGNKGEWSEVYVLLKLLSDGELYAGDEDLNKVEGLVYPIMQILRDYSDGKQIAYSPEDEVILVNQDSTELGRFAVSKFAEFAQKVLIGIKEGVGRAFPLSQEIHDFLEEVHCVQFKAKSTKKTDIQIVLYDPKTQIESSLGFSIKSKLGANSTLLNASGSTGICYKLSQLLPEEILESINAIGSRSKVADRIKAIYEEGVTLSFHKIHSATFNNNLRAIDGDFNKLLPEIVLNRYLLSKTRISDLVEALTEEDPLDYNTSENDNLYKIKFKRFLRTVALGMQPATPWTGDIDATGGYIVVKEDGELVSYQVHKENLFNNYILANTYMDSPSSSRHNYGVVYEVDGVQYFDLNFQIRFDH